MKRIIKCKENLEVNNLKLNDTIFFKINGNIFEYKVEKQRSNPGNSGYLFLSCYGINYKIFNELGIFNGRYPFCSYFYGYESTKGGFPEAKKYDYEALTRLVIGLYDTIKAYNIGVRICHH